MGLDQNPAPNLFLYNYLCFVFQELQKQYKQVL